MSENSELFTGRVNAYIQHRQGYPAEEVLELLRHWCGLRGDWVVADVGAGTGMLSEVFLVNGNRVIAIEPNAEMRTACAQIQSPLLTVVDATAEDTGLAAASVDLVSAGRAFHWFDTERALAEFRRILRPGGWVVLVSVGRATAQTEQTLQFERLLKAYAPDHAQVQRRYRVHDSLRELFGELHHAEIHGEQHLDWSALQGWAQSISFVPRVGEPGYEPFLQSLRRYFETYANREILIMATTCWVNAGR